MLSHLAPDGKPQMVDVGDKTPTERVAIAQARVRLPEALWQTMHEGELLTPKGGIFTTAIIAGTMAVKRTAELIPFCHPLPIDSCKFEIGIEAEHCVAIRCRVRVWAKTGVEMEALTGASIAALTVYDMGKAISSDIVIEEIKLLEKHGGKQDYVATSA